MEREQAYKILSVELGVSERDARRAYRALVFELEEQGVSDVGYPVKKQELDDAFSIVLKDAQSVTVAPTSVLETTDADPSKTTRRRIIGVVLGAVGIGAIFVAYQWAKNGLVDPGGASPANTMGMIACVEREGSGSRIVIWTPEGKKLTSPGYGHGDSEIDLAWRPDGNRLLFVSNREDGNYNLFRWNPESDSVERRTQGNRAKTGLTFSTADSGEAVGLFTSGGLIFSVDQKTGTTTQVVPPPKQRTQGTEGESEGSVSQLEAVYKQIGSSFLSAKWGSGKTTVWATMRRETDEILVLNPLIKSINNGLPAKVIAGKRVEFDVSPNGDVLVISREMQLPDPDNVPQELLLDGKPNLPYDSVVYVIPANSMTPSLVCFSKKNQLFLNGAADAKPVYTMPEGKLSFGEPSVSTNGKAAVFTIGKLVGENQIDGRGIVVMSLAEDSGLPPIAQIMNGPVSQPCLSPANEKVAFVRREANGKGSVWTASATGGEPTKVSDDGDYMSPKFSPQKTNPKSS